MPGLINKLFENDLAVAAVQFITRPLHRIWPKDPRIIIFTGMHGRFYFDNGRFLFEHFTKNHLDAFDPYWATNDEALISRMDEVEGMKGRFFHQYSIRGAILLLKAGCIADSFDYPRFPIGISDRTLTVQLTHGIPLKTIGVLQPKWDEERRSDLLRYYSNRFKLWISSSEVEREKISLCTGLPPDRIIVAGIPRNDYLIEHRDEPDGRLSERFPFLKKKVILYAPTWRENSPVRWLPFDDLSMDRLNELLERNDAVLLLRGHQVDEIFRKDRSQDISDGESDRILLASRDDFLEVQELLPHVDVLISDYSGIWLDFLLLNRPIVLIPYDLEEYQRDSALLFDLNEIAPGPLVDSFATFVKVLEEYLQHPEVDSDRRERTRDMFHEHQDGKACERIYGLISEKV